jgi:NitT/TauT family transport system substrate-binding protein
MNIAFKKLYFLLLSFLFLSGTGMILSVNAEEKSLEHVKLIMDFYPYISHAPFLITQDKGFFKEEGLEVEMMPGQGSTVSTKLVGNKEADFGLADATTTIMARSKGMPLVSLAVMHQRTHSGVFSLKESNIRKPKDLIGKRVSSDLKSKKHNQFLAFLKKNNINPESVIIIPATGGGELEIMLIGQVDACLGIFNKVGPTLQKMGKEYNSILFDDYGIHLYDTCIITNEDIIKQKPDVARRFVRACLKGIRYTMEHPEEAVDNYIRHYPEGADKATTTLMLDGMFKVLESKATKEHGLGYQTKEGWEETQNLIFELGLIEKKLDVNEIYTNDFR